MLLKTLTALVLLIAISLFYLTGVYKLPLHIDEHEWIRRGNAFFLSYFVDRDYNNPLWQSYYSIDQPKLGEYFYGSWNYLFFGKNLDKVLPEYSIGLDLPYSSENWWVAYSEKSNPLISIPQEFQNSFNIIILNRFLAFGFSVATLLIFFFLALNLFGYFPAIISVLLLAINPIFYFEMLQAKSEPIFMFFFILSIFAYILFRKASEDKKIKRLLILGLLTGLCVSIKLTGLIIFLSGSVNEIVTHYLKNGLRETKKFQEIVSQLAIWAILTFLVFLILNPFLWKNPILGSIDMVNHRYNWTRIFQNNPQANSYSNLLENSIATFHYTIFPGYKITPTTLNITYIDLFLVIFGVFDLFGEFFRFGKQSDIKIFIFLGFLGIYLFTSFYFVIGFIRYLVPIIPFVVLLKIFGLLRIMQTLRILNLK